MFLNDVGVVSDGVFIFGKMIVFVIFFENSCVNLWIFVILLDDRFVESYKIVGGCIEYVIVWRVGVVGIWFVVESRGLED